ALLGAWELTWTSESRALVWRIAIGSGAVVAPANKVSRPRISTGFRFTAISASPYLPFDRCVDGSEYHWPNGPDDEEPPDHDVAPRKWTKLPGGHAVYYHHGENYGALGIIALETNLNWTGIGSRRFIAESSPTNHDGRSTTWMAITFPEWQGS